ncbi:MAG: glycoside hydrolase family 15 protein [Deltaproteobacteria bacterium]|nr:glycoside hydrolase family 15 protein [Deltaproteobacteria bacterium]
MSFGPGIGVEGSKDYEPIRDYALIGDCHGSALVARDGSIDWCCLGRFDADPVFCRILDVRGGGFLSVRPAGHYSVTRSYVELTNILTTVFHTEGGTLVVTDFMPVGRRPGSGTHNYVDLVAPSWLIRTIAAARAAVAVQIRYRPTVAFGAKPVRMDILQGRILVEDGPALHHNADGFALRGEVAEATITLEPGQKLTLVLCDRTQSGSDPIECVDALQAVTTAFWREWIEYCRYKGPYVDAVRRSLLAIKLLIYAPSGAIVAAPTTSLPEQVGGIRNWDYRYCWLRDAAFALYALAITGYGGEARRFSAYLPRVCAATAPDLRIMYGIEGETDLEERVIDDLEGYRGSRPVRVGNAAYLQRQIDVYGEILDWALLYGTLGGSFDLDSRLMLSALADYVAGHWHEPDHGIWEMRGPLRHHIHGKIMSWVALDRAIRVLGENQIWLRERDRIAADVTARGVVDGHLVQAYGHTGPDASLLLTPTAAFPLDEKVLWSTIETIERKLRSGDFIHRYCDEDGLEGTEGAFLICSFWLVDALLFIGRQVEAKELFQRMMAHANDLGLYSEEIDPETSEFLGNFPQAYTHLALVGSAIHLALFDKLGAEGLSGTPADRAKRMVSATLGWRAILAVFKATWRVGRIVSSKASILELPKPIHARQGVW